MNYNEYIKFVKERSGTTSDDAAKRTIETVLEVLGQVVTAGQAEDLAEALPPELKPFLRQMPGARPLSLNEFLARIREKERVPSGTAEIHARAVLSVLAEWIPRAELRDTLEQIPNEIRPLFTWIAKAA
jgi:uncharacterized protein (DUF2267 family)